MAFLGVPTYKKRIHEGISFNVVDLHFGFEGRKEFMKGFLSSFTVSHMKLLKRLLLLLFKGMEWAYSILFLLRVGGVGGYSSIKKVEGIKHAT